MLDIKVDYDRAKDSVLKLAAERRGNPPEAEFAQQINDKWSNIGVSDPFHEGCKITRVEFLQPAETTKTAEPIILIASEASPGQPEKLTRLTLPEAITLYGLTRNLALHPAVTPLIEHGFQATGIDIAKCTANMVLLKSLAAQCVNATKYHERAPS
jgi:hypothetical protein